jgi:hypothetical protein
MSLQSDKPVGGLPATHLPRAGAERILWQLPCTAEAEGSAGTHQSVGSCWGFTSNFCAGPSLAYRCP